MKQMEQKIQELKEKFSVVTKLTDEVINSNSAHRVLYVKDYRFDEDNGSHTFFYKILYFDTEENEITHQIAESKYQWIIDKSMMVHIRDLEKPNFPPKVFDTGEVDDKNKPITEFRQERADIQLRNMAKLAPLPMLVEFYAHDLDKDGKFSLNG